MPNANQNAANKIQSAHKELVADRRHAVHTDLKICRHCAAVLDPLEACGCITQAVCSSSPENEPSPEEVAAVYREIIALAGHIN